MKHKNWFIYTSVMNALLANHPARVKHELPLVYGVELDFDPEGYHFCLTGFKKQIYFNVYGADSDEYIALYLSMDLEALLEKNGCRGNAFLVFQDDTKQIAVLFSRVRADAPNPYEMTDMITRHVQSYYARELIRGERRYLNSSSLVQDISGLDGARGAFKRARYLNDLSFFLTEGVVFTEETVAAWMGGADYPAVMDACHALERHVSLGDVPGAEAHLQTLMLDVLKRGFSMALVRDALSFLKSMLTVFATVYALEPAVDVETLCDGATYITIKECHGAFRGVVRGLANEARQRGTYQKPVMLAVYYVKTHYGDPGLSLTQIAEYALVNPNYLSGVFREQTGQTVRQCITRCRLDEACALLRSTGLKVSEIGVRVGFDSAKYFTRLFKNQFGVSPQAYRDGEETCSGHGATA